MVVEVKICGLTNEGDAQCAVDAGADYIGFVLYSRSPRGITAARMRTILDQLSGAWRAVGVFVNESPSRVAEIADQCGLHAVQIHGDEAPGDFRGLDVPVWRSVAPVGDDLGVAIDEWAAARYVVDAHVPEQYGGSGEMADWTAARRLAQQQPIMLAGGLTPANVNEAIRSVMPLGVDTSSGVEKQPGMKDHRKVNEFVATAKATRFGEQE